MIPRTRTLVSVIAALSVSMLAACGGGDDGDDRKDRAVPIDGTYVGKVEGTNAFVAVVAGPAQKGKDNRNVTVYVCDAKKLCEWLPGSADGNEFTATSSDRDAKAKGTLSAKGVTGTIEVPGGDTVRYTAPRATATAGLYDLEVGSNGKLTGASEAGVGLTGKSTLPNPGNGTIKLADGQRLAFDVTAGSKSDPFRLKDGQARLIVLPGGQLRGVGKTSGESGFYLVSTGK